MSKINTSPDIAASRLPQRLLKDGWWLVEPPAATPGALQQDQLIANDGRAKRRTAVANLTDI